MCSSQRVEKGNHSNSNPVIFYGISVHSDRYRAVYDLFKISETEHCRASSSQSGNLGQLIQSLQIL